MATQKKESLPVLMDKPGDPRTRSVEEVTTHAYIQFTRTSASPTLSHAKFHLAAHAAATARDPIS
jgi:hypothetical protein